MFFYKFTTVTGKTFQSTYLTRPSAIAYSTANATLLVCITVLSTGISLITLPRLPKENAHCNRMRVKLV